MPGKVSASGISSAALQVWSREELSEMSRPQLMTIGSIIADLIEDYPIPTQAQLEGCREMYELHFTMIRFGDGQ